MAALSPKKTSPVMQAPIHSTDFELHVCRSATLDCSVVVFPERRINRQVGDEDAESRRTGLAAPSGSPLGGICQKELESAITARWRRSCTWRISPFRIDRAKGAVRCWS